jgi:hypothetical protein
MEAKDQNTIRMKNEVDFFALIEKKLEEQGFEVLDTSVPKRLSSDRASMNGLKSILATRSTGRFAY